MNYSILLGDYLTFHHKYEITHFFFITLVLKRIQSRINTSSIFAKSSAGLISSNSSSTRLFTPAPLSIKTRLRAAPRQTSHRTWLPVKVYISVFVSHKSAIFVFVFVDKKSLMESCICWSRSRCRWSRRCRHRVHLVVYCPKLGFHRFSSFIREGSRSRFPREVFNGLPNWWSARNPQ